MLSERGFDRRKEMTVERTTPKEASGVPRDPEEGRRERATGGTRKKISAVLPALLFLFLAWGCDDNGKEASPAPTLAESSATATPLRPTPTATPPSPTSTPTLPPTPSPSPTPPASPTPSGPRPVRGVPYDVRDTSQPHQLSVFNSEPGGGSVGMPVEFGDFDGDGFGDFVACPMLADSGPEGDRRDSGEVHIYYGDGRIEGVRVNAPESGDITTIMGARAGDLFGVKATVADLDEDGFDDIVVGAQNYDGFSGDRPNAGAVFVYRGRAARPRTIDLAGSPEGVVAISGKQAGDRLGVWVATGDVDGDGHRDLLLGADQADGQEPESDRGAVYVVFGGQSLPDRIDLAEPGEIRLGVLYGVDPGDHFGSTILAEDFDRDGRDDLAVAAGLARGSSQIEGTFLAGGDGPGNERPDAGEVYVLFGPFSAEENVADIPADRRLVLYGAEPSDVAGEELAAGDLDGDGAPDLVVGSLQASGPGGAGSDRGSSTGRTYVVFDVAARRGQALDLASPGPGITTIYGRRKGSISGDTLVVADMDGDGIDDLWDASPQLGTRDSEGTFRPGSGVVDILFGAPSWPARIDLLLPPDDLRLVQIRGGDANDMFGYGLALGDADGDGRFDVISNAMAGDGFRNEVLDAGEFYVVANEVLFEPVTEPRPPLFLNLDIQPIFSAACLPCHGGENPDAGLDLSIVQESIEHLFGAEGEGVRSSQVDSLLVDPGNPDGSYLLEKLVAPRFGDVMPPPPATPLPGRVISEIRRWIAEGAKIANEDLPPPPPPPAPPARGFRTTFFARMRFVLSDPALGVIESVLLDPPAPIPIRIVGPRITIPASEFETITIPGDQFGDVDIVLREDGTGTIDRETGEIELSVTFVQIALGGAVETLLPARLTTGPAEKGPFTTDGAPLDPKTGSLKLVDVATIPEGTLVVGGDPVLVELEGSVAPLVPRVPSLSQEIQPIFDASCALANCHIGDGAAGLDLEPGLAFGELVRVPSTQVQGVLVDPGNPDGSYLFEKVAADTPRVGSRMPIATALDPLDVEAIRLWILGGAPE
ncbi:MAG: hypothetical protein KatS3mg076_3225 [Candidatus Binatia bacterium]|nr:MAG: hypothetical protein KatS3mg076_3225 [Candidatus Binatia bacterium]